MKIFFSIQNTFNIQISFKMCEFQCLKSGCINTFATYQTSQHLPLVAADGADDVVNDMFDCMTSKVEAIKNVEILNIFNTSCKRWEEMEIEKLEPLEVEDSN